MQCIELIHQNLPEDDWRDCRVLYRDSESNMKLSAIAAEKDLVFSVNNEYTKSNFAKIVHNI